MPYMEILNANREVVAIAEPSPKGWEISRKRIRGGQFVNLGRWYTFKAVTEVYEFAQRYETTPPWTDWEKFVRHLK